MPAPRPRHSCPIVAYSPCHARAMPAPRPRHLPVPLGLTRGSPQMDHHVCHGSQLTLIVPGLTVRDPGRDSSPPHIRTHTTPRPSSTLRPLPAVRRRRSHDVSEREDPAGPAALGKGRSVAVDGPCAKMRWRAAATTSAGVLRDGLWWRLLRPP
eukprot:gene20317-biopygen2561